MAASQRAWNFQPWKIYPPNSRPPLGAHETAHTVPGSPHQRPTKCSSTGAPFEAAITARWSRQAMPVAPPSKSRCHSAGRSQSAASSANGDKPRSRE